MVLSAIAAQGHAAGIKVSGAAVPLDPRAPNSTRVGALDYRGGLALRSNDSTFGGLSALHVAADGASLVTLSDRGRWWRLALDYDARGWLAGARFLATRRIAKDEQGRAIAPGRRDSEALVPIAGGGYVVAFEHDHRIWQVPPGSDGLPADAAIRLPTPPGLAAAPGNMGIEALVGLGGAGGAMLALTEGLEAPDGALRGWIGGANGWAPLAYRRTAPFRPTDAARLPNGDVLVLERAFGLLTGAAMRLVRIAAADIHAGALLAGAPLAQLRPPLTVDNFEGLALRQAANGETLVYLLSDDNFSPLQRTYLLMFALLE